MHHFLSAVMGFHRTVTLVVMLLLPLSVQAEDDVMKVEPTDFSSSTLKSAGSSVDSLSTGYLGQLVVGLVIVLLCIVALAWIAKRFNRLQSTPDGSLRVLGGMSMGARERIVLVQVGENQLLLGVAPGRINTLHVLDQPLEAVSGGSDQPSGQSSGQFSGQFSGKGFAEKLTAALSRNQK